MSNELEKTEQIPVTKQSQLANRILSKMDTSGRVYNEMVTDSIGLLNEIIIECNAKDELIIIKNARIKKLENEVKELRKKK